MTTTVGVRELKSALSRYLRLAAAGENIVVCDHGRPLAVLSAAPDGTKTPDSTAAHLAGLAARGLVVLSKDVGNKVASSKGRKRRSRSRGPRLDLSGAVREDREERP
jgi:prevent-host-death family protein